MKDKIYIKGCKAIDEISEIMKKYQLSNMEAIGILFSMLKSLDDMNDMGIKDIFKTKGEKKWQNED